MMKQFYSQQSIKSILFQYRLNATVPLHTYCTYLSDLIKPAKQLVECLHQIGCRQLLREGREVHNVGIQNGHVVVPLDVHFVEPGLALATGCLTGVGHFQHNAAFHLGCNVGRYHTEQQLLLLFSFAFQADPLLDSDAGPVDGIDVRCIGHDAVVQAGDGRRRQEYHLRYQLREKVGRQVVHSRPKATSYVH